MPRAAISRSNILGPTCSAIACRRSHQSFHNPVAAIVANGAALAAKTVTTTVPIVFVTGSYPVRDSFNRPGGLAMSALGGKADMAPWCRYVCL